MISIIVNTIIIAIVVIIITIILTTNNMIVLWEVDVTPPPWGRDIYPHAGRCHPPRVTSTRWQVNVTSPG